MLLSLRNDHKEHLTLLTTQTSQVLVHFCKLAIDYLQNGPNTKLYNTASQKLQVDAEAIQNAVCGLINLLLESCKHKLNEADFRDSVLSVGFPQELQIVLSKFYDSKKDELGEILSHSAVIVPHFYDLDWRFEVQVASRCLLKQVTPMITMNLCLEHQPDVKPADYVGPRENIVLQTDVTNLLRNFSGSHCKKV
ncbi:uncharacterized protein CBL_06780 [Carabus blaptoides fortunei]